MKKIILASVIAATSVSAVASDRSNLALGGFISDLGLAAKAIQTQYAHQGDFAGVDNDTVSASGAFPRTLRSPHLPWILGTQVAWESATLDVMPYSVDEADDRFMFNLSGIPQSDCQLIQGKLPRKGFNVLPGSCEGVPSEIGFIPSCFDTQDCKTNVYSPDSRVTIRDLKQGIKAIKAGFGGNYLDLSNDSLSEIKGVPASWLGNGNIDDGSYHLQTTSYAVETIDDAFQIELDGLSTAECVDVSTFFGTGGSSSVLDVSPNGSFADSPTQVVYSCNDDFNNVVIIAQ